MTIDIAAIEKDLLILSIGNETYASFNRRIVNTQKTVLGVRVPDLRKLAKNLAKTSTVADIEQYINTLNKSIYEQVLLAGLMINDIKVTDKERLRLTKNYLKLADSWAEIDIFASRRKKYDEKLWWDFAVESLKSPNEFVVRYGVIEMMANYINPEHIELVFMQLRGVKHGGYYVRMAMAWLYATAAVEFYQRTLAEISESQVDTWVKKKSLTKMLESRQFTVGQKGEIRNLRTEVV